MLNVSKKLNQKDRQLAQRIYLILGALFITSLVVCNLIFQKFFYWYPFDVSIMGEKLFQISVGLLPYPITFLITDAISELYGKKKANEVIMAGIFASAFSLLIIWITSNVPATDWSPVDNQTYRLVFGNTVLAVIASMLAYLFAQFIDVQVYHFWKNFTQGKHLWLRNNLSTFTSQFVDTAAVLLLLCRFDIIEWKRFGGLMVSGVLFKMLVALLDTPFLYAIVYAFRKKFKLEEGEEINIDI